MNETIQNIQKNRNLQEKKEVLEQKVNIPQTKRFFVHKKLIK